jgi:hypothetical protein
VAEDEQTAHRERQTSDRQTADQRGGPVERRRAAPVRPDDDRRDDVARINRRQDLEHLYPTDERNFVRTYPAGHLTAAAMAQFAKQKGVKRLFLSWDGNYYWGGYAADGGRAAKSLGIQIAGAPAFDPKAQDYDQFARRIAATGADAVMLAAFLAPSTPALLRDLRAGLGPV